MCKLNVCSIFNSIDGEYNCFDGAGQLTTFIRLKGCNLSCGYCDTAYSQSPTPENWMTINEIIEQVHFKKVTITGGEPLLQQEAVNKLCVKLMWKHPIHYCKISIETNGSIKIDNTCRSKEVWENTRYVVDYKLPSSGMNKHMKDEVFQDLRQIDVIKFVIANDYDYKYAKDVIDNHPHWVAKKVFSPAISLHRLRPATPLVPNMDWPRQLVEKMIRDNMDYLQSSTS